VKNIPVHARLQEELSSLQGEHRLLEGEVVLWMPSGGAIAGVSRVQWYGHGVTASRERVVLRPGEVFRYVKPAESNVVLLRPDGQQMTVTLVRNIGGSEVVADAQSALRLARIDLVNATKEVVMNRLGRPTRMGRSPQGGGLVFEYVRQSLWAGKRATQQTRTTTGFSGSRDIGLKTAYDASVSETITYNPYAFRVHFNAEGLVTHVEDLITKVAQFRRR
jgi:hypothetical protein